MIHPQISSRAHQSPIHGPKYPIGARIDYFRDFCIMRLFPYYEATTEGSFILPRSGDAKPERSLRQEIRRLYTRHRKGQRPWHTVAHHRPALGDRGQA